jgi:hypothetical protein
MAINVLIIDDDKRPVTRLVSNLRRADTGNALGVIEIDDTIVQLDMVEKYDVSKFNTTFDVALIDYQLTSSFTGILISAWIALHLRIPRMALSTAAYPGDPSYFNGAILKKEITDAPMEVIQRIVECVETYNSDEWLNNQHKLLVEQYQCLLKVNNNTPELSQIEELLDRFERILDEKQDSAIKKVLAYESAVTDDQGKIQEYDKRFDELYAQLQKLRGEIDSD